MNFAHSWQENFYHLKHFGYIGEDILFVVSGFIIALTARNNSGLEECVRFLIKRFVRINPLYYLATIIFLVVYLLHSWIQNGSIETLYVINGLSDMLLMFPVFSHQDSFTPLLKMGWVLSFLWLFYLMFSLFILLRIRAKMLVVSALIIMLVLIGRLITHSHVSTIFVTNPILLEFVLGMSICQIYLSAKAMSLIVLASFLIAGLGMYGYMIIYGFGNVWDSFMIINEQTGFQRLLTWGIASALIVFACVFLEKEGKLSAIWRNKWVLLIGEASYAIFLVHLIVLELFALLYHLSGFILSADLSIVLHICVSVLAGCMFHLKIGKNLLLNLRKIALSNNRIAAKSTSVSQV